MPDFPNTLRGLEAIGAALDNVVEKSRVARDEMEATRADASATAQHVAAAGAQLDAEAERHSRFRSIRAKSNTTLRG